MNVGSFPIHTLKSSSVGDFDLILANRPNEGMLSYGTFLFELPEEFGQVSGDVASITRDSNGRWVLVDDSVESNTSVKPIMVALDTGSLTLGLDHRKKMRQIRLYLTDLDSESVTFSLLPYADGVPFKDPINLSAYIEDGEIVSQIDPEALTIDTTEVAARVDYTIDLTFFTDPSFSISDSVLTKKAQLVLNSKLNAIGRSIGFTLLIPTTAKYKLGQYTILYKSLTAR
jgi:hypothetical protein